MNFDSIRCPIDSTHDHAGPWKGELIVEIDVVPKPDLFWSTQFDLLCLPRIAQELRAAKLSGLHCSAATLKIAGEGQHRADISRIVPIGWGGFASKQSGLQQIINCSACRLMQYSVEDKS